MPSGPTTVGGEGAYGERRRRDRLHSAAAAALGVPSEPTEVGGGAYGERRLRGRRHDAAPAAAGPPVRLSETPRPEWDALVGAALSRIGAGELEKVVVARRSHLAGAALDLPAAAARMARAYPGCVRFAFERGGAIFLGASPERLVLVSGARVEVDALAGSIPRVPGEDEARIRALLSSDKDRREQALVIDGIRAALAPFGAAVSAPGEPVIRALKNVFHLSTPIRVELPRRAHALSLAEALHPTPAVCGLPRPAADEWLAENEPLSRGWYAAPVGWFDAAGDGELAVAIRSGLVRGGEAWLYAGAGIVRGSEPAREYAETAAKQAAMLAALGVAP